MKILFYTDVKFEYMAKYLIESLDIQKVDNELLYYTIGFNSTIDHPRLIKRYWEVDDIKPRFEFYKPSIFLDALKYDDYFIFFDSDIIVGHRFDISKLEQDYDYPLASIGNWDKPYAYIRYDDDGKEIIFDEKKLMSHLLVKEQTMPYVYTCFLSINKNCISFLKEWETLCSNSYLLENCQSFYPFQDETSFNVLLWKRKAQVNYGRIYLNTLYSGPLKFVENYKNYKGNVFDIPEQYCDNSSKVIFYHGLKDINELDKSIDYLRNKSVEALK